MNINLDELKALSPSEKLQLVEILWDDLGESQEDLPLPDWVEQEAIRRRDEMLTDPKIGLSESEMWQRVDSRNE